MTKKILCFQPTAVHLSVAIGAFVKSGYVSAPADANDMSGCDFNRIARMIKPDEETLFITSDPDDDEALEQLKAQNPHLVILGFSGGAVPHSDHRVKRLDHEELRLTAAIRAFLAGESIADAIASAA